MSNEISTVLSTDVQTIWTFIEWVGSILGVAGTIWAALKKGEKLWISFLCWLVGGAGLAFMYLLKTQQHALFTLSAISFVISLFGFFNYLRNGKNETKSEEKNNYMLWGSGLFLCLSLSFTVLFFINITSEWYTSSYYEWAATCFNLAALTVISSNTKYSKYCWIFWSISNAMIAFLTYNTGQMGVFSQQIFFSAMNIWGIYTWFILKRTSDNELDKITIRTS